MATILAGTVMAYAGEVKDTGKVVVVQGTATNGWLLCNGAALNSTEYRYLAEAIKAWHGNGSDDDTGKSDFNLPDYRGYFLRGVSGKSGNDPDINLREQNHPGGNVGNRVGSVQPYATALPKGPGSAFVTNSAGSHHHPGYVGSNPGSHDSGHDFATPDGHDLMSDAGDHFHTVTQGGDHETRPRNAYVNWIICTGSA